MKAERKDRLETMFREQFGKDPGGVIEAPGRVELLGNHTDHQRGKVLAASVDLTAQAAFAENGSDRITVCSEGYAPVQISLSDLMPDVSEFQTTKAIIRGVMRGFYDLTKEEAFTGCRLSGFDVCIMSDVLTGSGLSSSAAFEVLLGRVVNRLFFDDRVSAMQIAKIGQFAENRFFGKPSGLMDQAASSIGNVVFFDFEHPDEPSAEQICFSFEEAGYALCAVSCGADHADLTEEYAAIPRDMKAVAKLLGKQVLREAAEEELLEKRSSILEELGERPYLRALHFYEESRRAEEAAEALRKKDMETFLRLANASGKSSRQKLANVIPVSKPEMTQLDQAMRYAVELLGGKRMDGTAGRGMEGAVRMNGGGFSGTFLAVVPLARLASFRQGIEEKLGSGSCMVLHV